MKVGIVSSGFVGATAGYAMVYSIIEVLVDAVCVATERLGAPLIVVATDSGRVVRGRACPGRG
jgi:hypothetical protein